MGTAEDIAVADVGGDGKQELVAGARRPGRRGLLQQAFAVVRRVTPKSLVATAQQSHTAREDGPGRSHNREPDPALKSPMGRR